jgi:hypothetical protein
MEQHLLVMPFPWRSVPAMAITWSGLRFGTAK